ncbi:MAG: OmpP1/FadL family transporter [Candidatus Rifleibacteriota bacterium]
MKKYLFTVLISAAFVILSFDCAFASGFQIYQSGGADAMALGAATVGRDDLVSSAWYNPAAVMDFKKPHYSAGVSLVKVNWDYEPGNGIDKLQTKKGIQFVPSSHLIYPVNEKFTAAFSFYVPFGLAVEWHDEDIKRLADSGLFNNPASPPGTILSKGLPAQTKLQAPYFNSTIATRLNDKLSVAGGLSVIKANFKMRILSRGTALPSTPLWDTFMKYQADGWGLGYVLAAHYKQSDSLKFGLRYLSHADVDLKGTVEDHPKVAIARVKGTLKLPSTLTIGFVKNFSDRWQVSCDIMRNDWSRYDELRIEPRDQGATQGGLLAPKNWEDSYSYRFGAEYKYSEKWSLRGGYVLDKSPLPTETRGLELAASDGHIFSIGASRKVRDYSFDIGYSYMILENADAGSVSLNSVGEFTNAYNHFLMFSYNRAF